MSNIIGVFVIIEFFVNMIVIFYITLQEDEYEKDNNFVLSKLGNFIKKLFIGKNFLGICISLILFILLIPSFLLFLVLELIMWIVCLFVLVWDLGNKNKKFK